MKHLKVNLKLFVIQTRKNNIEQVRQLRFLNTNWEKKMQGLLSTVIPILTLCIAIGLTVFWNDAKKLTYLTYLTVILWMSMFALLLVSAS